MEIQYPRINVEKTGENIKKLRQERNMPVGKIQKIFGFNAPTAIYKWESGASLPSIDNLVLLSKVFNVTIEDILIIETDDNE